MSEPLDLDAIEARANLATPGPWHYELPSLKGYPQRVSNDAAVGVAETFDGPEFPPTNAEFIAHARTDVPALVAEVRSLRGQRARLDDMVAEYRKREETQVAPGVLLNIEQSPTVSRTAARNAATQRYWDGRLDALRWAVMLDLSPESHAAIRTEIERAEHQRARVEP